jgi:hypothetical protein
LRTQKKYFEKTMIWPIGKNFAEWTVKKGDSVAPFCCKTITKKLVCEISGKNSRRNWRRPALAATAMRAKKDGAKLV